MTRLASGTAVAAALAACVVALGGCGADSRDDRAVAAHRYAAEVAHTTDATRATLAATSRDANYRDPTTAAATTRAYAAAIRSTAEALTRADPPSAVAARHGELVALYRQTAARLDALAAQFEAARGDDALTALAQDLSGEVQTLSTQEAQVRAAIDAELARVAPTTGAAPDG